MGKQRPVSVRAKEVLYHICRRLPVNRWILVPKDAQSVYHPRSLYQQCADKIEPRAMFMILVGAGLLSIKGDALLTSRDGIDKLIDGFKELTMEKSESRLSIGGGPATKYYFIARYHGCPHLALGCGF